MSSITTMIKRFVMDREMRFRYLSALGFYNHMPDRQYLEKRWQVSMRCNLDLENPQTFNEKLQWLKLYDRRPEYTMMVDKYKVREYIAKTIGEKYLIPLLGVWDSPDEIDFNALPNQFVLKCNHNSGIGMCICRDKSKLDIEKAKRELRRGLKQDYYLTGREWPYKDVPRKIIAEKYMTDESGTELRDYKFFCFDGVADCVMVCTERETGEPKFYFFDKKWELRRWNIRGKNAPEGFTLPKPPNMDKMFELAERLSQGISYVRVDLYNINGNIYFGELTFYPQSGFDANILTEADFTWGKMVGLSKLKETN